MSRHEEKMYVVWNLGVWKKNMHIKSKDNYSFFMFVSIVWSLEFGVMDDFFYLDEKNMSKFSSLRLYVILQFQWQWLFYHFTLINYYFSIFFQFFSSLNMGKFVFHLKTYNFFCTPWFYPNDICCEAEEYIIKPQVTLLDLRARHSCLQDKWNHYDWKGEGEKMKRNGRACDVRGIITLHSN